MLHVLLKVIIKLCSNCIYNILTDTQVTTATTATPTDGIIIFMSCAIFCNRLLVKNTQSMSSEFTAMRTKFGRTFLRMQDVIEKHQPSIERFLKFTHSELTSQLSATSTIDDILSVLQKKCSLIDIKLLEAIVKEFELKAAEKHIDTYKEEVAKFYQTMSVHLCLNETFQVSVPHTPLQCETATFVLDWES